jgi:pimeloyl-ACP methyl ester carboxylesterase
MVARVFCLVVGLLSWVSAGLAEERPPTAQELEQRTPFQAAVANLRRIATPNGIEEMKQVRLGGVDQWITIRGRNRANPVLLVIHGGPGTPTMPLSWAYQSPWEDYFTVVNWDQRGAGKNWAVTDADALRPTMSLDRLVADASELTDRLRKDLGKERILVLGFSYGTIIGAKLAMSRPDALYAYAGVGQYFDNTEADVYKGALARSRAAGDTEAIAALNALSPYPRPDGSVDPRGLVEVRRWVKKYNGAWYGWPDLQLLYQLPILAPEYDAKDLTDWPIANGWFGMALTKELQTGRLLEQQGYRFRVPMLFMMGRHDLMTPYVTARRYYNRIEAPSKAFITFDDSAHFVMLEEPGRFLIALVDRLRPYAVVSTAARGKRSRPSGPRR